MTALERRFRFLFRAAEKGSKTEIPLMPLRQQ
jgi:hypothetical protein